MIRKTRKANFDIVFVFGLFFLFAILALMIVGMGSQLYQRTLESVQSNYESQTSLSYITNKFRYLGTEDVRVEETKDGPVIYITESFENEPYQTVIYFYNGYLNEQFKAAAEPFQVDGGTPIIPLQNFDVHREGNLLQLEILTTTDKPQTLSIALLGGGQP